MNQKEINNWDIYEYFKLKNYTFGPHGLHKIIQRFKDCGWLKL